MSAAPYISKLTGDLVIEETVNELRAEMALMHKEAEKDHASDATSVYQRFKDFLGLAPRMFARRSATS